MQSLEGHVVQRVKCVHAIRRHSPGAIAEWITRWREAGIHQFYFVDNTFNLPPSYGKEICKNMNKRSTLNEVRQISERLSQGAIRQMGFLLLGSPGETRETVEESFTFADSLKLDTLKITVGVRIYPHTNLAKRAIDEGVISSHDDLLFPRFYLAKGLEDWLAETLKNVKASRPHWVI